MIFLLSPAKTLNFETPSTVQALADPAFVPQSTTLIALLKQHTAESLAQLMSLSPALAQLNVQRYQAWQPQFTQANSKPAVLAFNGDVYEGFDAPSLSADDLAWAHEHVAILSGLYGVLRPLDRMQPYRLEMGTALANPSGRTLYAFWGDRLAAYFNARLSSQRNPLIVNLASQEYFQAVSRKVLQVPVLDCVFEDWKPTGYKIVSFFAKRARGLMVRFAVKHRLTQALDLQNFDSEGYAFAPDVSDSQRWVFRRKKVV